MYFWWELEGGIWGETKYSRIQFYKQNTSCITKWLKPFNNIIFIITNRKIDTKSMDSYTESALNAIITLSYDTLKDTFFHFGVNISDFPNL